MIDWTGPDSASLEIPGGPQINFLPGAPGITCADCDSPLRFAEIAAIKIAACQQCGAMLIQREVLADVIRYCRQFRKGEDPRPQPMNPADLRRLTPCLACGQRMETFPYAGPGCVVIDACQACDLAWLDGGELRRIAEAPGR